ncbi:hypothetical protein VOLCADRAFT_105180 [Volvox carteri f. nagariensis]|uniref:Uncharacterized protein mot1 n=1 Tax=Volvox carteri f. nagariensis TaxID=3068 RepID=D8TZ25_VOLCA|nr:uncharacterized protein VOLCADRAFT_105180 [Volvox carteri f. nagariensis]EFJ47106.1 hypothetical protein VOLCADRAFT_105180 [Volvox carteri f. nagariensis]|eukprot:XP_002951655.1 hypothetical protein VOLCADRAFT_105180 [Volvox carteri f. nagariensis]
MPKSLAKQKDGVSPCGNSSVHAAAPERTTGAADAFRSPVGCTSATPGEDDFLAWCSEERVRFPSSRLATLPDTGRALVASRNIKMGEVVVEVPDDAVLMADNCTIRDILEGRFLSPTLPGCCTYMCLVGSCVRLGGWVVIYGSGGGEWCGRFTTVMAASGGSWQPKHACEEGMCKPADDEILEVQGLIIAVMYEKSRGRQSRWAPYLNLIPDDMTHMPLYWKHREFKELRGTAAYDKMMGKVQCPADAPTQVPVLWSEVVEPFIQEHPELELPEGKAGYDLYRWATCAVASYSFILGDDKYQAMVPVWDLLNHITGRVNVRLHHCAKRHVLHMIATRDILRGEELVNNYGELSNAELLRGYGFVEARNRNNHVQVPLGFVVRAATELLREDITAAAGAGPGPGPGSQSDQGEIRARASARLRLARRCDLLPQHHVFKIFEGRPPPPPMTALIHLLLASDADIPAVRGAVRRAAAAVVEAVTSQRTTGCWRRRRQDAEYFRHAYMRRCWLGSRRRTRC